MNIAQRLYEGVKIGKKEVGIVTYIRTDSVRISDTAKEQAVEYITNKFGPEYIKSDTKLNNQRRLKFKMPMKQLDQPILIMSQAKLRNI